ncbi:MAG: hypothetical protein MZU84_04010 [Sphingobacterium sp.]|nr:hypothetical protein [Sphingobacterium sp.]
MKASVSPLSPPPGHPPSRLAGARTLLGHGRRASRPRPQPRGDCGYSGHFRCPTSRPSRG